MIAVTTAWIDDIARRHGISGQPVQLAHNGVISDVWKVGGRIVRIVREGADADTVARERAIARHVTSVRMPALIADGNVDGRPYTVHELVEGSLLATVEPHAAHGVLRELGRELAKLHALPPPNDSVLLRAPPPDPIRVATAARAAGAIDEATSRDVASLASDLRARGGDPPRLVLAHRDLHAWNVMVTPQPQLAAILDWGDAGVADPAIDFAVIARSAVTPMLEGYKEAGGGVDRGFRARARWYGLTVALWEIRRRVSRPTERVWWRRCEATWAEHLTGTD